MPRNSQAFKQKRPLESDLSATESPPRNSQGPTLLVKKMLTSARGKTHFAHLLDSNYHRYSCDGEYQGNKHWRCLKEGCKSRVHKY